ncbi:putative OPA3-like protein CG13603 [Phlebotomus argentipes]|uniref:putative OPA3-like protein CG13603 n=1 Tax=Phlebotomus argentipes TaxID=94469 RepID=UPI002892EF10|nr:putative OPA3-like protein CG13603 [Phlebotomus argentipes]
MVVGAFPAAKLGVLFLKQISKPIANFMKNQAKKSPFFRQYICMPPAQLYNWWEVQAKMWSMNLGKPTNVQPLNEAMAIELGANLLGEVIIFAIGAGLLILEYTRQVKKDNTNQEKALQEKLELNLKLQELQLRGERQDAQLRELTRILADVESRTWLPKKPFKKSESSPALQTSWNRKSSGRFEVEDVNGRLNHSPVPTGFIHRALELVEEEIFSGDEDDRDEEVKKLGRISQALVYLRYQ